MKKALQFLLLMLVFSSCKKEKKLSFAERYDNEVYKLLNTAFLPTIEITNPRIPKNLSNRQLFETTFDVNSDIRIFSLYSDIKTLFKEEELVVNNELRIIKWDKNRLNKTRIIDSLMRAKFYQLTNELEDTDFPSKKYDSIKYNNLYKKYIKEWNEEIGNFYVQISYPIFDKNFSKAVLIYKYYDNDFFCGTGKTGYKEFIKLNNNWILKDN